MARQPLDELGVCRAAQRGAVGGDEDAERSPVLRVIERVDVLGDHVALAKQHDAPRLATHEFGERRRVGEQARRETHLPNDIAQGSTRAEGFTCNQQHSGAPGGL